MASEQSQAVSTGYSVTRNSAELFAPNAAVNDHDGVSRTAPGLAPLRPHLKRNVDPFEQRDLRASHRKSEMRQHLTLIQCILVMCIGASTSLNAQTAPPGLLPSCGGRYDLCGYAGPAGVIPQKFESDLPFSEGLAPVRIAGRFGYIDEQGTMIIEPQFELAGSFHLGRAEVVVAGLAGVIDRDGKMHFAPQFARAVPLTADVILASEGTWTWRSFHPAHERLPNYAEVQELDGQLSPREIKRGLYHMRTGWLTKSDLVFARFDDISRGLIWARDESGLFGLMRLDGTWQVQPAFSKVTPLHGGRAVVQSKPAGDPSRSLYGAVDANGNMAIPFRPNSLTFFANGIGLESIGDNYRKRLIDADGNALGELHVSGYIHVQKGADVIEVFSQELITFGIDRSGRLVDPPSHGTVLQSCPSGVRFVRENRLGTRPMIKVVGPDGTQTVPYLLPVHDEHALSMKLKCDRPTAYKIGSKWSYIGTDGKLLFDPPIFEPRSNFPSASFEAGHAAVRVNGKYGIIDDSGRFTLEPTYDELKLETGSRTVFYGRKGHQSVRITAEGKLAVPQLAVPRPVADRVPVAWPARLKCQNGNRLTERDGNWGISSPEGLDIIEPRYRAILCFERGLAWVPVDATQQWCPVGADGQVREGAACRSITDHEQWPQSRRPFGRGPAPRLSEDPYEHSVLSIAAELNASLSNYKRDLAAQN